MITETHTSSGESPETLKKWEETFPKYLPQMQELYSELFGKGKGWRAELTCYMARYLQLAPSTQGLLAKTVEFIHNASLLHDDLVDRTPCRRQKVAAWLNYSPECAVLAGDYLLTKVMMYLSHFGNLPLIQYTSEVILNLLEGEWLQDALVCQLHSDLHKLDCIYHWKTSSLFCWCLRSPWWVALEGHSAPPSAQMELHQCLNKMGEILGILFQRGDDLLDFDVRNHEKKKILCDLQASYLNSVAVFLLKKEPSLKEKGKRLFQIKSMEEIYNLVGKQTWQRTVQSFDEMNQNLISTYEVFLKQLVSLPLFREFQESSGQKESLEEIRKKLSLLPRVLYLREQSFLSL